MMVLWNSRIRATTRCETALSNWLDACVLKENMSLEPKGFSDDFMRTSGEAAGLPPDLINPNFNCVLYGKFGDRNGQNRVSTTSRACNDEELVSGRADVGLTFFAECKNGDIAKLWMTIDAAPRGEIECDRTRWVRQ